MTDVVGRGTIELVGDARRLKASIEDAKKSIRTLGEGQKDISKSAQQSIDKYIGRIKEQNAMLGKTRSEQELYKLALRGASNEQINAAKAALTLRDAHERNAVSLNALKTGFIALGTIAVTASIAAAAAFDQLVKKAGSFQDMAEKVGDTAENLASLSISASVGGASMDAVVAASVKLTKGLTGVDDESKAAGAAIAALGLNLKTFKDLKPADQFEAVAKALAGFEEGTGKTAVAVALFGKAGAEMLPFLKELGAEGGRQTILTSEQIRLADEYSDKQKKLTAQISLHAQAIASKMLPAYNDLQGAFLDLIKGIAGVEASSKGLNNSDDISEFADRAAESLAFLVDMADGVSRSFLVAGKSIGGSIAFNEAIVSGELRKALTIAQEMGADIEKILQRPLMGSLLDARIAARKAEQANAVGPWSGPVDQYGQPIVKPKIKFGGAVKTGAGSNAKDTAAQEAKAQLAFDLEQIRKSSEATIGTYANAAKIMEAMRAANLVDDKQYYASKLGFLNLNSQAQEDELQKEIERLQQEKLTGKDKIDNAKAIAEAQAKLAKVRADAVANIEVNSIQEAAANKKIAQSYIDATEAAQAYIDTVNKQNAREIAGIGRGEKFRANQAGISAIEDKQTTERQRLERDHRNKQITDEQFAKYLAVVNDTYAKEIAAYEKRSATLIAKEGEWINGATEALQNYYDESRNIAKQTEQLFAKAFQSMEDALVNFVMTGKLDFKSLANSIMVDIARMQIKASITGPLSKAMNSGSLLSTIAGWLSGGGNTQAQASGSEFAYGGRQASGGDFLVTKPTLFLAGEAGPERATFSGAGNTSSRGMTVTNVFNITGAMDGRSQAQIAAAAGQGVQRAMARNT